MKKNVHFTKEKKITFQSLNFIVCSFSLHIFVGLIKRFTAGSLGIV